MCYSGLGPSQAHSAWSILRCSGRKLESLDSQRILYLLLGSGSSGEEPVRVHTPPGTDLSAHSDLRDSRGFRKRERPQVSTTWKLERAAYLSDYGRLRKVGELALSTPSCRMTIPRAASAARKSGHTGAELLPKAGSGHAPWGRTSSRERAWGRSRLSRRAHRQGRYS